MSPKISPSSAIESEVTDRVTQQLIEAYYATADKKQLQIFSLFARNFTKETLLQFVQPQTQPKIDAARNHASVIGPGHILNSPKIPRIPDQTK